jgi:hypothetical protein
MIPNEARLHVVAVRDQVDEAEAAPPFLANRKSPVAGGIGDTGRKNNAHAVVADEKLPTKSAPVLPGARSVNLSVNIN